jgi:hypothetical protein
MGINACFVHSRGCSFRNSSAKIPELITSWFSISRTVRTIAFLDHGGFPLRAAMNSFRSSLRTAAIRYGLKWPPIAWKWIHSHPSTYCFLYLLLPVLRTIFKCASWVICMVAALAASRWTTLCLHSCCVPRICIVDVAPANLPVFDPLSPGGGGCVFMMCWCGIEENNDNERKWEALRTI